VLLFDNCGFGCINNLEITNGIGNPATEFRSRGQNENPSGGLVPRIKKQASLRQDYINWICPPLNVSLAGY